MLAIANGRPETLNLKGILKNYLDFQYENNTRKYQVLLEKEQEKKEIKEGLITACDCIDLIIAILRGSKNLKDAKACLMEGDISKIQFRTPGFEEDAKKLHFTEKQASAILEMRLYKLIGLEILALQKEYKETLRKIKEYQKILGSREAMDEVIKEDLRSIKEEFAVERRTKIEDGREAVYDEAAESAKFDQANDQFRGAKRAGQVWLLQDSGTVDLRAEPGDSGHGECVCTAVPYDG